jgi:hypothetical protein
MWPVDKYSWKVEHDFTLIDIGNKAPAFVVRRGYEQGNSNLNKFEAKEKGTKASWARRDVCDLFHFIVLIKIEKTGRAKRGGGAEGGCKRSK